MVPSGPVCRGFVLTGGNSRRMGRDKALLPFGERPMAVWMAELAQPVCSGVSLVGSAEKYGGLGFPVIEDVFPGHGPLGGIHAALASSEAPWNLILGCDLPYLSTEFLRWLVEQAKASDAGVVIPQSEEGRLEPLCAVYGRACLPDVEEALRNGERKISRVFERWRLRIAAPQEWKRYDAPGKLFRNLNTPEEYEQGRAEWLAGNRIPGR